MLSKSQIKYYSSLKQKKIRFKENKFIAEGKRLIQEGLNSSYVCETVIVNFSFAESNSNFINNIKSKGFKVISCSNNDFSKLTSTDNPQGILAIFKSSLPKKEIFKDRIIIGLENISDPGNLGTILRSCDWFGVKTVIISEGCAELFNPKVIRASMGAIFHLNILEKQDIIPNLLDLKKLGYQTFVADMEGENYTNINFNKKSFVVFCNEANGPSKELSDSCFKRITIPSKGKIESLNVAAAAAVILSRINN